MTCADNGGTETSPPVAAAYSIGSARSIIDASYHPKKSSSIFSIKKQRTLDSVPSSGYIEGQLVGISMTPTETKLESRYESKTRFLSAAVHVIRAKGYSAVGMRREQCV